MQRSPQDSLLLRTPDLDLGIPYGGHQGLTFSSVLKHVPGDQKMIFRITMARNPHFAVRDLQGGPGSMPNQDARNQLVRTGVLSSPPYRRGGRVPDFVLGRAPSTTS